MLPNSISFENIKFHYPTLQLKLWDGFFSECIRDFLSDNICSGVLLCFVKWTIFSSYKLMFQLKGFQTQQKIFSNVFHLILNTFWQSIKIYIKKSKKVASSKHLSL